MAHFSWTDGTSRVVVMGDHPNIYSIDPTDTAPGWTTTDSKKGFSAYVSFFSLGVGRLQVQDIVAAERRRLVFDEVSLEKYSSQVIWYPELDFKIGFAKTKIPSSYIKCDD